MHKGWHIGASFAAVFFVDSECWAQDSFSVKEVLEGIDVGGGLAEHGKIDTPALKAAGKFAGAISMAIDIDEANANLEGKWRRGEDSTSDDFIAYALPLGLLTPAGQAGLLAIGVFKLADMGISALSRQETPPNFAVDPDGAWKRGIQADIDAAQRDTAITSAVEAARLAEEYASQDLGNIDPYNFRTDSFSVEYGDGMKASNQADCAHLGTTETCPPTRGGETQAAEGGMWRFAAASSDGVVSELSLQGCFALVSDESQWNLSIAAIVARGGERWVAGWSGQEITLAVTSEYTGGNGITIYAINPPHKRSAGSVDVTTNYAGESQRSQERNLIDLAVGKIDDVYLAQIALGDLKEEYKIEACN